MPAVDVVEIKLLKTQRMLFGVLSVLESAGQADNLLNYVNWEGIGISRGELELWYRDYKRTNAVSLARNTELNKLANRKNQVLDKLTTEEKHILGLLK